MATRRQIIGPHYKAFTDELERLVKTYFGIAEDARIKSITIHAGVDCIPVATVETFGVVTKEAQ
ncbi:MAG TPA: hypothetical protein VMY37_38390 [Thermoguttaceae bacterium]|nr:hypothetical protein [Thermoguttaceae bacterium]